MGIRIREAETKDIPVLLELLDYIRGLHHKGRPDVFKSEGTKYTAEQLEEKITCKDGKIFVAFDGDVFLGYAITELRITTDDNILIDKRVIYVDDLCVSQASRGRGIGRMLIDAVKEYARTENCASLELNVWKFDGSAEGFYRSYGFTTMSRRMEYKLDI